MNKKFFIVCPLILSIVLCCVMPAGAFYSGFMDMNYYYSSSDKITVTTGVYVDGYPSISSSTVTPSEYYASRNPPGYYFYTGAVNPYVIDISYPLELELTQGVTYGFILYPSYNAGYYNDGVLLYISCSVYLSSGKRLVLDETASGVSMADDNDLYSEFFISYTAGPNDKVVKVEVNFESAPGTTFTGRNVCVSSALLVGSSIILPSPEYDQAIGELGDMQSDIVGSTGSNADAGRSDLIDNTNNFFTNTSTLGSIKVVTSIFNTLTSSYGPFEYLISFSLVIALLPTLFGIGGHLLSSSKDKNKNKKGK